MLLKIYSECIYTAWHIALRVISAQSFDDGELSRFSVEGILVFEV